VITRANQGWAFEVDAVSEVAFSILTTYDGKTTLFLSNSHPLLANYFDEACWEACKRRDKSSGRKHV